MTRALLALSLGLSTTAMAGSIKASSQVETLQDQPHTAAQAVDARLDTSWIANGPGEGEWLELRLDTETHVKSVSIWPGEMSKGARSIREFARPHTVTVELDTGDEEPVTRTIRVQDGAKAGPQRLDIAIEGTTRTVRIRVDQAYFGPIYDKLAIAEVGVNFSAGDQPSGIAKVQEYMVSSSGIKAAKAHREEVIALFDKVDQEEFGDRDSLQAIMELAMNGSPWVRSKVERYVPVGFRMQALPGDVTAIEALLKLGDVNAVPAIEMAALRANGQRQAELMNKAQLFEASAEIMAGGRRNIPVWGEEGFEKGAFRSLGEPLAIRQSPYGEFYIADTGNNRMQVFAPNGRLLGVWGDERGVTRYWFEGRRAWYATGAKPSDAAGRFKNPVAVEVAEGSDGEEVYTLDASGRVQVFDAKGTALREWRVDFELPISGGVGGEGHLAYSKGKLVVLWGNEGFTYSPDGELLSQWELEDGAANGVVVFKNGNLGVLTGYDLVEYSADGFRYRSLLGDSLGRNFEFWSVALDEKGKLWVVTDSGWIVKYKKPGKIEFKVRGNERGWAVPRFAVVDSMLFITTGDKIEQIDALKVLAESTGGEE